MKMLDLSRKSGVDKNTISKLYHGKMQGLQFDTLERICRSLDCPIADLLEIVPDEKQEEETTPTSASPVAQSIKWPFRRS